MAIAEQETTRSLNIPISPRLWKKLAQAAFAAGQSIEDFAVSALMQAADAALTPEADPLDKVIGIFKDEPLMDALMERVRADRRVEIERESLG